MALTFGSYRTPLCVLYTSRVIAVACYILAQHYVGAISNMSMTLADRISSPAPSASLPTPPSHKTPCPDSRFALEFFNFNEMELASLSGMPILASCWQRLTKPDTEALTILLEFYAAQDLGGSFDYLADLAAVSLDVHECYGNMDSVVCRFHHLTPRPLEQDFTCHSRY